MLDISRLSSRYEIRKLNENDADEVMKLFLDNMQYYKYREEGPSKESFIDDLHIAPPGMGLEDKYFVGFYQDDRLIAIMDLIDGYPENDYGFIGFFMMDKTLQGHGTGTDIVHEVEDYLKVAGKNKVRLGIEKENPQSTHFWKKNGYKTVKEVEMDDGRIVLVAEKVIEKKAVYHLPGLFEFYEFYRKFLRIYKERREYFFDWCEIGSIYGAPADCIWGGGRVGFGEADPDEVLEMMREYGISARLTFSNSLLREEHLSDKKCNGLCAMFESMDGARNGVIVHSDLLLEYLKENYPKLYLVSSTTKVLSKFVELAAELKREDFEYVVPDFRLNKAFEGLNSLSDHEKDKVEFLCNECCHIGCMDRKACYENVSRKSLGEDCPDFICIAPGGNEGYSFSKAMMNPGFISVDDIVEKYLPMGFSNFKIEGRSLGSAIILEFLLYYMIKPECQLKVREMVYLDSMLDLF